MDVNNLIRDDEKKFRGKSIPPSRAHDRARFTSSKNIFAGDFEAGVMTAVRVRAQR
jgi:hypothetical protein